MTKELDPTEIADGNLVDIEKQIEDQVAAVGPLLDKLFKAADNSENVWLKGKDARTLATWIMDLQNVNILYEKQLVEAARIISEDDKPKKRLWKPGF